MTRFLIRRVFQGLIVMWLMTITVFVIFFIGPGPAAVARTLAGRQATPAQVAQVAKRLLLDRPLPVQYGHFLWLLLHGNLGYDYYHDQSVNSIIGAAFPITFSLLVGAAVLWLTMGVLSGIVSAVRTRSIWDRTFTTLALIFYSMPTFVLGFLLILGFYYELTINHINVFPAPGTFIAFSSDPVQWARALILPWFTLALVSAAVYTRLTRNTMLDVFGEDYIRTARSKGMSERRVIFRHALRSAMTPLVTQAGLDIGALVGGAIVTEQVFGLPGLGFEAIRAIVQQDLPVVIGVVLVASAGVVAGNLVADIFYAVLDPRVRLH